MANQGDLSVIHEIGDYGVDFGVTPLSEEDQRKVKEQDDRDKRNK